MTDGVIDKVNIKTATFVIHYEFASTKKMFGKRMFSMASSYPSTKVRTVHNFFRDKPGYLHWTTLRLRYFLRSFRHKPRQFIVEYYIQELQV